MLLFVLLEFIDIICIFLNAKFKRYLLNMTTSGK